MVSQDELYVVVRGQGTLCHGGDRDSFGPGDCLFVYGPPGGEWFR